MSLPIVPCGHTYSASIYRKRTQQQPYQDYWSRDPTAMYAASRNKNASYLTFTALCVLAFNHTYRKSERSHRRIIGGVLACHRMQWQFYACCILCDVNRLTIRSCLRQGPRSVRVARVARCGELRNDIDLQRKGHIARPFLAADMCKKSLPPLALAIQTSALASCVLHDCVFASR